MAEIDDVRSQIAQAAESGDDATVARLSTRYRDLQAAAGQLQPVGRGFVAQTGREYQLAQRALTLRRAGRDDEATNTIRVIARERYARNLTRNGQGRGAAALFGADRGILNLGTLASGARELVEDVSGNRNQVTARQHMQDFSAAQDLVRERHPVSAGVGEVGGTALTLAVPGGGASAAARQAPRVARVARAAAQGAGFGGAQGASDAYVRDQDVAGGALRGARNGAAVGGALSIGGQILAPAARALANRFLDNQGLRRLAEHVTPQQLNAIVAATRQYQRQFSRAPTLLQAASMADETVAASAGRIVEGRAPASQVARQGTQRVRVQAQRDIAEAVLPNSSNSSRVTTEETNRAMRAISGSAAVARPGTAIHDFLTSPDVSATIQALPPSVRASFDDVLNNGAPVSVRMLDDLRQEMGNLAKNSGVDRVWTEVANDARRFADDITGGAYSRILRQHGQNALREGIANEALRSPAAAQKVAGDLAESAQRARDITAELGPAEATRIRNAGSTQQRILRGADAFEPPRAVSASEEAANVAGEVVRAAALPKTGGAGIASAIIRNAERLGMTTNEATRFARDFTDPSRTPFAIRFLQQRIGAQPTWQFLQMLERAGIRPTVERVAAVGGRLAAQGPSSDTPTTQEPVQAAPAERAEPAVMHEASAPSRYIVDIQARAEDALNAGDESAASELNDLADRLSQLEQLIADALGSGDEQGASALREEYFAILNNER